MKSNLIIVIGMPGTGKTTLAKKISDKLNIPLISKDEIKVMLFDALSWKDMDWSKKIGSVSYKLIDYVIEEQLKAKHSLIVESTFIPQFASPVFKKWQTDYGVNIIQVFCFTEPAVARQRYVDRQVTDASAHPSHPSHREGMEGLGNFDERIINKFDRPLELEGSVIKVDTTDFAAVDTSEIIEEVQKHLVA